MNDMRAFVLVTLIGLLIICGSMSSCYVVDRHTEAKEAAMGLCWTQNVGNDAKHLERCK